MKESEFTAVFCDQTHSVVSLSFLRAPLQRRRGIEWV